MTSRSRTPHKIREIERTVLPNGVRVVTERMPHVRSVSVGVWIGTGSREESLEETGISHFIEHMVFKGTKNRSAEQIARSVDSIGGGLDAFTSKELVSYNVKVLDEHLPRSLRHRLRSGAQSAVREERHREGKGRHSRRAEDGCG